MPRNVSDIYFIPPGTEGFPDTTIESEKYNNYIHDVRDDLNRPRPIVAGGTGADDADEALANLGAEKASQAVVNYDTHVFFPGSFYSAASATASAVSGHAFVGWAISSDPPASPPTNANVIIHAKDQSDTAVPSALYVREKKVNVWGPWKIIDAITTSVVPPVNPPDNTLYWDNEKGFLYIYYNDGNTKQWVMVSPQPYIGHLVQKAGDTMTGLLVLSGDPVADMDAVTKRYVDGGVGGVSQGKVDRAGDTMTGLLTLSGPPTADLHAATKLYVDESVLRYQRISLAGGKSFDVQVPATATAARLTGVIHPTTATTFMTILQVSVDAGVFKTSSSDYQTYGFEHDTGTPNEITTSTLPFPGYLIATTNSFVSTVFFNGTMSIALPSTGIAFSGYFEANSSGPIEYIMGQYTSMMTTGASALRILAFRLTTVDGAGDNWDAESYLNVEWM